MKTSSIALSMVVYDPATGKFAWNPSRKWVVHGAECGYLNAHGYRLVHILGGQYYCHRLAWEIVNGEIPAGVEIDHINGDRQDNRIVNLRLATRSQNLANAGRRSDNTSGYKGVSRTVTGRWRATIQWHGKRRHIGSFDTAEDASAAYALEAERQRGEFARIN